MELPPLLSERPRRDQILLGLVVPAVFGAVAGFFVGTSEGVYLLLAALALLGAIAAGFDHVGAPMGMRRGALAGLIFGAFILIAHEIHGEEALATLPEPAIVLVGLTAGVGAAFGGLGGWLRLRLGDYPVSDER